MLSVGQRECKSMTKWSLFQGFRARKIGGAWILVFACHSAAACQRPANVARDASQERTDNTPLQVKIGKEQAMFVKVSPRGYSIDYPDFYLMETEVTNRMYREYLRATGNTKDDAEVIKIVRDGEPKIEEDGSRTITFSTGDVPYSIRDEKMTWRDGEYPSGLDDHPAALVTLPDAQEFCEWLATSNPDKGLFRLPTWNEWMIAAYGSERAYPWGEKWDPALVHTSYGHSFDDRLLRTEPVKGHPQGNTPEGLYGMLGNVAEYIVEADATSSDYFNLGARWMGGSFGTGVIVLGDTGDMIDPREDYWGYSHHAEMREADLGFRVLLDTTNDRSLISRPRVFEQQNNAWREKPE
jgi:formylglycine-generating enzyme required for sulfatase activity